MGLTIIGFVFSVAALVVLGIHKTDDKYGNYAISWRLKLRCILAVLPLIISLCFACIKSVPTGYTGILTTFGKVEDRTVQAGINVIAPWQKIICMDNRDQKDELELYVFSSDIQEVKVNISVNHHIDSNTAQNLYKTVGTDYYNIIVNPRTLESVTGVFSVYNAEELIANRNILSDVITEDLTKAVASYGIIISGVNIENIDFTDAFTDAVEAKQVATQKKAEAETEQAQKTMEAEEAAKRSVIEAQAKAEVAKVEADAELYKAQQQAAANKAIADSMTEGLIDYTYAQNWDGKLPNYVGTGDGIPVIGNVGS